MISEITVNNRDIKIFRDDLYPNIGGGNKGRKMDYIGKYISQNKYDSLVTTGGIQSNHCRAVALFAAQNQMSCTLVIHGDKHKFENDSGNAKIMRLSGAKVVFAEEAESIGELMDQAMEDLKRTGRNPYYIWGGGHTIEGGLAYIDAINELKSYCFSNDWKPDYIYLGSGTGSTQAGIMAGLDKYGFSNTQVVGISVGRKSLQAQLIVEDFYHKLCLAYKIKSTSREAVVLDEYLCGGYGKSNDELERLSTNSIKNYGMVMDSTYSGKAFYGMIKHIQTNSPNGNILFWHTGGIFNFLAN
ncbi:1-aminocyclopropane-1-carboxylate deaminase/D-cysteine desulfhydrase [Aequorivita sinensis]|uniref:1-aminocyclopropane-1-carboxylate deaminase/D-cysteine desulfhydrase n=1 Tax=Aequorivita sinensis TaxID=1382458 RepID=UPI0023004C7F|nr:pyridoxal-phosphate dependent enzyme [Aequorivita sinensis]